MPPVRKLIFCGEQLEKSNAGETKFATMLIPMVAVIIVSRPIATARSLPTRLTVSIGSVIMRPNSDWVPETITTVTMENSRKLNGSPQRLPRRISPMLLP